MPSPSIPPGLPQFRAPGPYGAPPAALPPGYGIQPPVPPPSSVPWAYQQPPPQRPASVGIAATLAVTASLQWICALSFAWLVATAGAQSLQSSGSDGNLFHILNRFHYRMIEGLAWPLYLVPAASLVLGFWILSRKPWTRIAFSSVGVLALAWLAWLLRDHLIWWIVPAAYIATGSALVWTRAASAWYGWGRRPAEDAGPPAQP